MSETIESLQHQIVTAAELHSVVRTMKALAAAGISQYEHAVVSLQDYYQSVESGLSVCIRQLSDGGPLGRLLGGEVGTVGKGRTGRKAAAGVIVFGSDQGLVGQFNGGLVQFCRTKIQSVPEGKAIQAVGERMATEWQSMDIEPATRYELPVSVSGIGSLVNRLLLDVERQRDKGTIGDVYVFHNRPSGRAGYEPVMQRLLPLVAAWSQELSRLSWPGERRPEVIGGPVSAALALIREYLFVSLYKACAESLAAENASRLAAMQHAEKNIEQLSEDLLQAYHRLRQEEIDEELSDILSGAEALVRRTRGGA